MAGKSSPGKGSQESSPVSYSPTHLNSLSPVDSEASHQLVTNGVHLENVAEETSQNDAKEASHYDAEETSQNIVDEVSML